MMVMLCSGPSAFSRVLQQADDEDEDEDEGCCSSGTMLEQQHSWSTNKQTQDAPAPNEELIPSNGDALPSMLKRLGQKGGILSTMLMMLMVLVLVLVM
mmetsp:Transcript_187/g.267  ORF Transcript_187/g.267 Transcript_187/m.267 type:complete len:98 (+) Transcript_187:1280-1573(+)